MPRYIGDTITQDPDSTEPWGIDWTLWLAELGASVTIAVSTYAVDPTDLTLSGAAIVTGSKKTQVLIAGGTPGVKYTVTNHITTSSGAEDDGSFVVWVEPT